MIRASLLAMLAICLAVAALAHTGVRNAAVKARMHAMGAIGAEMKVLAEMAKGKVAFDGEKARSAAAAIAVNAAETPALFEARESDPKSEARADIWSDFPDFIAKSEKLEALASELSVSIATREDLGPALQALGGACQACHAVYRMKN